ncbi:hypothetical protein PQQ51_18865 [Paraburkholderia xenovorans]|uniref:hypothetical protein n=1 Tax=Paraburkholderia xenovorans TaxID=36873 RepID=UPI0038BDB980
MRRDTQLVRAWLLALATLALAGCGADDSASTSSSSSVAHNEVAPAAAPTLDASAPLAADPAAASDAITQNMQASLAADNQQIAPVMHYAPGDNGSASN